MNRGALVAVALAGLALVVVTTVALGIPTDEALVLAGVAGGAALATGVVGAAILAALRSASLTAQLAVVALTSVAAVGAGALAAGSAMFLSAHDLDALVVIVAAAAAVGVFCALALGQRFGRASALLGEAARRLGDGGSPAAGNGQVPIREFQRLADELDQTAARLDEARARERAADAARRELVAWVSHDLRTPLSGIRAIAEALDDGVVTDRATVDRYHRTLLDEAERLALLVNDLFELSSIWSGALPLVRERVSVGDLASDVVAAASPVAEARGVHLDGWVAGRNPTAELSAREFTRVLQNLVDNAVRETPPDGTVTVETREEDGCVLVLVTDSCGGIPEGDLPRVFEAGFRGSAARTPRIGGGGGMGLAIARGLMHAYGGDLTVRNAGEGCEFTATLPTSR